MDASTFDRWVVAVGHRRTRRTSLRLLASALLGGLVPRFRSEVARAAIAEALFIGQGTARSHLTSILGKFAVGSRIAAVATAIRLGLA